MTEKDRSQLLRMAGNIACGLVTTYGFTDQAWVAKTSAEIAIATMKEVDRQMDVEMKE